MTVAQAKRKVREAEAALKKAEAHRDGVLKSIKRLKSTPQGYRQYEFQLTQHARLLSERMKRTASRVGAAKVALQGAQMDLEDAIMMEATNKRTAPSRRDLLNAMKR